MDDSDSLLFTSLLQMKIKLPQTITSLADIKTQQLQSIIIQMLQLAGANTTAITELNKAQKFRVATKLNQQLTKTFHTQFQLNDLMSTNINVIRKILISLMSKMSMIELDSKNNDRNYQEEVKEIDPHVKNQAILDGWLKKEWVHPSLTERVRVRYCGHQMNYDIQSDEFGRKDVLKEIRKSSMNFNLQEILADNLSRHLISIKRKDEAEGVIKHQANTLEEIKSNNKEDWKEMQVNTKKMMKARKKFIETVQIEEKPQEKAPTIFQQQVEELRTQTKEKEMEKQDSQVEVVVENDDPLNKLRINIEEVKRSHEREIQELNEQLLQREAKLNETENSKIELEEEITKNEELITVLEEKIQTTKVSAQKVKRVVDGMNSSEGLEGDIAKLKTETKEIQQQAAKEISMMKKDIKEIEKISKENLDKVQDIKLTVTRIQQDYSRIIRQLAQNQKKKTKIHVPTQGITRTIYNKKIFQNESKLRESKEEIKTMTQDIDKLQSQIKSSISASQRIETQIQNLIIQDKKYQDLQKQFKDIYNRYKTTYQKTFETMRQLNIIREESREYETRVRDIANKNYKETIEKLNSLMG